LTCPEETEPARLEAEAEDRDEVRAKGVVAWAALRLDRGKLASARGVARRWLTKRGCPATR
jgi:hypothetical protein